MDKFQAGFELLYLLSAADGDVSMSEVEVIRNFLQSNYGNVSFNPSEIIDSIDMLNADGMIEEFKTAATIFKNSTGVQDRKVFLNFAVELILSDGNLSDDENTLFHILAEFWNIDVQKFIRGLS